MQQTRRFLNRIYLGLFCLFLLSASSCHQAFFRDSVSRGSVEQVGELTAFEVIKKQGLLFIPVEINGQTYQFLLDTGAGVNAVDSQLAEQLGLQKLRSAPVGNAADYRQQYDFIEINQLKINGLVFKNTLAITEDFSQFPLQIPNFGGIIGQPVISKAHWKIDFEQRQIELAQQPFAYSTEQAIAYEIGQNHLPYVPLTILEETLYVVLDTGCSDMLDLPKSSPLSRQLMNTYPVRTDEFEVYTLGQQRTIQVNTMQLPELVLGKKLKVEKVLVLFDNISEAKLGAPFFRKRVLIIDTEEQLIAVLQP